MSTAVLRTCRPRSTSVLCTKDRKKVNVIPLKEMYLWEHFWESSKNMNMKLSGSLSLTALQTAGNLEVQAMTKEIKPRM